MVTKTWKNWNSLTPQSVLVWKFYRMLYFHLVDTLKENLHYLSFARNVYIYQKTSSSVQINKKQRQILANFWPCYYLDVSFFRSSRSQKFYKLDDIKDSAKQRKAPVPESLFWKICRVPGRDSGTGVFLRIL